MKGKLVLSILVTLALAATVSRGFGAYSVQETLLVMLCVAALVVVVFLFLVVFVLFREGARLGFAWLKARFAQTTSIGDSSIVVGEAQSHPRPLK